MPIRYTDFYVYVHYRNDGITPFYVGKGRKLRVTSFSCGRSKYWNNVHKKEYGRNESLKYDLLRKDLSEEQAYVFEKFWIGVFGRAAYDEDGILVNLSCGGEGGSSGVPSSKRGVPMTPESKLKMSLAKKGKPSPKKGKKMDPEFGRKMSMLYSNGKHPLKGKCRSSDFLEFLSRKKRHGILVLEDPHGQIHEVTFRKQFCEEHNLSVRQLTALKLGEVKHHRGWKYLETKREY